jgi:EAL domain-containing protein (putative c-di-GMP-specific phosphodiesterase class I)
VLEESCPRWRAGAATPRSALKLAVNVSVHQMRGPDFPGRGGRHPRRHRRAERQRLCLELTESVFAGDMQEITRRMHELCAQGVCFSLDDFGTGYSSLAYLKRFPLAALKIDRSFVHDVGIDPDSAPIVEAIIALARKLKLEIVAEGVEHEAQRQLPGPRRLFLDAGLPAGAPAADGRVRAPLPRRRLRRPQWASSSGTGARSSSSRVTPPSTHSR